MKIWKLDLVRDFFAENGAKYLLFNYAEPLPSSTNSTSEIGGGVGIKSASGLKSGLNKPKCQIVKSSNLHILRGLCIFFVRNSTSIEITYSNIAQEVCFGFYDCQHESLLQCISRQFSQVGQILVVKNDFGDSKNFKL